MTKIQRWIRLPNLYKKKKIKVKKNATIKFIKTLIKFISENHTDEITYVRLLDN